MKSLILMASLVIVGSSLVIAMELYRANPSGWIIGFNTFLIAANIALIWLNVLIIAK